MIYLSSLIFRKYKTTFKYLLCCFLSYAEGFLSRYGWLNWLNVSFTLSLKLSGFLQFSPRLMLRNTEEKQILKSENKGEPRVLAVLSMTKLFKKLEGE